MKFIISLFQKTDKFLLMSIGIIFLSVVGLLIVEILSKQKKEELYYQEKNKKSLLVNIYIFFEKFLLTRRVLDNIRKRYEMICPEDNSRIMKKTVRTIGIIILLNIIATTIIFIRTPSTLTMATAILYVIIISRESVETVVRSLENYLLEQLNKFLTAIRHFFYSSKMVDTAIENAKKESNYMMKIHADKILKVLDSTKRKRVTEKKNYFASVSNKHLQMFMSLCISFIDVGDKIVNNTSLYLTNIELLRVDIHDEQLRRKEAEYRFFGMMFAIVFPVLFLEFIKNTIMNMIPTSTDFYNGLTGMIYVIVIFVSTVICYLMMCEYKDAHIYANKDYIILKRLSEVKWIENLLENYERNHSNKMHKLKILIYRVGENITPKQFFLKRILYFITVFLICNVLFISLHESNKKELLHNFDNITELSGITSEKQAKITEEVVKKYVSKYKNRLIDEKLIRTKLTKEGVYSNTLLLDGVTKEIVTRANKYQNEYYHWYEMVICILGAIAAYCFPYLMLLYRKSIIKVRMEDEVMQFQTKIIMIMHFSHTTVLDILEMMESFAVIFKQPLRECINEYAYGDIKALKSLRKKIDYAPMLQIIDDLISADKIGILKAFDEIEAERKFSRERKLQESKIDLDRKVNSGAFIAFIPAVLTMGYMLIPFMIYFMQGYNEYNNIMKSFY